MVAYILNRSMVLMQHGFELVQRKKKKKLSKVGFIKEELNWEISLNLKLERALEEFESSQFCFEILKEVENCLKSKEFKSVGEILCYGIGNFSKSKSSIHQLAALCVLHKKYNPKVTVYDPVFVPNEIKFLKELQFTILTNNEEGKRKITDSEVTLVFLPHCPKQLTNNFLWANWNVALCNCIIIANSFSKIIQDNTTRVLQESAEYILKITPKTTEVPLEDCYHIDNIFNDTSIHLFSCDQSFFLTSLSKEPNYSGDIELITKSTKSLALENGQ